MITSGAPYGTLEPIGTVIQTGVRTPWPDTNGGQSWFGYPYYVEVVKEPVICTGKAHVFECDHVPACQCGKIQRVMPRAKKAKRK